MAELNEEYEKLKESVRGNEQEGLGFLEQLDKKYYDKYTKELEKIEKLCIFPEHPFQQKSEQTIFL